MQSFDDSCPCFGLVKLDNLDWGCGKEDTQFEKTSSKVYIFVSGNF